MTIEHKLINDQLNLQGKVKDSNSYESVMLHLVLNLSLSNASVQPSSTARKRFRFFFNWNIFVLSSSLCVCVLSEKLKTGNDSEGKVAKREKRRSVAKGDESKFGSGNNRIERSRRDMRTSRGKETKKDMTPAQLQDLFRSQGCDGASDNEQVYPAPPECKTKLKRNGNSMKKCAKTLGTIFSEEVLHTSHA